jgi:hypothetical protein
MSVAQPSKKNISGPKEIMVLIGADAITNVITRDLCQRGIMVSVLPPNVQTEITPRYDLSVSWQTWDRCLGGGFAFNYITVELYDLVYTRSRSGYSEDCPPLSGTIFQDFANDISSMFTS